MSTSVTGSKCTVQVITPAGSPTYDATKVVVEVIGIDANSQVVHIHDVDADVTVVQATALDTGSVTVTNVPLVDASGNSIKVKHYNSPEEAVILGTTGIYVRAYP